MHIGWLSWEQSLQVLRKRLFPSTQLPHLVYNAQFWNAPSTRDVDKVEWTSFERTSFVEHTMDVKRLNKLGDEAQGASHHSMFWHEGSLHWSQGKIFSQMQRRRKEAMVKSCSEGNLDQRHGKEVCTPVESVESLSLEICQTCWCYLWAIWSNLEGRVPLSSWLPEVPSKKKFYMMLDI